MSSIVSYPITFLTRPCDRDLLDRLNGSGCAPDTAKLLLYRIWQDFASGGSDRRLLQTEVASSNDRVVELLESFCEWDRSPEQKGLLVAWALAADFLAIEAGPGGNYLVCRDFYPINSAFSSGGKSMQRKGALCQVLSRESRKADEAAVGHLRLWERAPSSEFEQFPAEVREQAVVFIHTLCNCAGRKVPPDSVLKGGLFRRAVDCLETSEAERKDTLLHLISRRKDQTLPADLGGLLQAWPELVLQAAREGV